jgi:wobble nucleotide-excising tRNase
MIERIEIAGCASYGDAVERLTGLKSINFIYGPNGAGKTTISRLIADPSSFSGCAIHWEHGTKLETLVYSSDFVQANFNQASDLKGIFTIGQKDIETQGKIEHAKKELDELARKVEGLTRTLEGDDGKGGKIAELRDIESQFQEGCWRIKVKHDDKLQGALTGYRSDKQKFKKKLMEERAKAHPTPILSQPELEARAASVFGPEPSVAASLPTLIDEAFLAWEGNQVLKRRVLGKADVDIAAMIQKLGNSDWVKQGVPFFETSEGVCPFCQQKAPADLERSLEEYFDETFLRESQEVASLQAGYRLEGERLQQAMHAALSSASRFLDSEKLAAEKAIFDSRFQLNLQRIETKAKEPSQIIALEPLGAVLGTAQQLLADANSKIRSHNTMVSNLASERIKLTNQVWAFLAHAEIAATSSRYTEDKESPEKAIASLRTQIATAQREMGEKEADIGTLEKSVTSVRPTVNEINRLLQGFGFKGFSIEATDSNRYRLRRADGSDAKETLSEGERGFITFLYFFHLLKGSNSESGITKDRVVVFDDPVSSLDSDVLFIVGSLIKQTIRGVRDRVGLIKQVFVLTHNVYFHKEVTFDPDRSGGVAFKEETYWTIRKLNGISTVRNHQTNPIKTSYDLLWSELREPNLGNQSIQNTMRRILEHYFRILGGVAFDDIVEKFDGEDRLICRSLFSWVHEGSHSVPDDIFHTLDEATMERFLAVFQKVFVRMGHPNHYNMMMGLPYVIESAAPAGA